ncbi:hypothetical protein TEA_014393 [Camellia sinensis var. sinensis]|uniref:Uncharacterized protein n=1 Tax=Camellia sinensis var. sinensis TaxID=542762 RepID=A0A4V3WNC6_CAMSN|nr:hypothetical protein TEA_014393 [Camellia sinensis var. sinensis]
MYVYSVRVCCTIHAYSCHGKLNTHFTPHILSSSALGLAHMTESSSAASVARGGTVSPTIEPPALTLKEFLDSFSEDENKEVKGVFEAYRRDVRGETGIFKNIKNSELRHSAHLDKVSARVMKKLVFEVDVAMPWENWDSTSKVIKDGNYMILEIQVSILKVLFSKYGDFSNRSRLSTKAIMLFIMTVCEAVYNMCNTKVVDITTSLLLTWFHSFALAQYANFEIMFVIALCEAVYNMCNTKVVDITTSLLLTWFHSFALAQYANFEIMFVIARLTKLVCAHFGLQADYDVPVYLNLAGLSVQIAKQLAVIDSTALAIVKQDGETDDLRKKVDSMQLTISKLDEAIQELENNKQAIGKKKQALGKKKQKHALEKNKKALLKTREENKGSPVTSSNRCCNRLENYVCHCKKNHQQCREIIHILEEEWSMHGKVEVKIAFLDIALKTALSTNILDLLEPSSESAYILQALLLLHFPFELRALTSKEFLDSFTDDENKSVRDKDEYDKIDMIKVLMKKFVSEVGSHIALGKLGFHIKGYRGWKLHDFGELGVHPRSFAFQIRGLHTKIGDITTSQLLIWLLSFTLAQYAGFEIQFVIARLTKLVHAHFGLQADDDIPIDLELAKMGVPIATQLSVVDSKELSNIEQDGETDGDLWKKVSLQLTIMKLDEAIEDLKKKKQALLKMQEDRCLRKECLIDVLELERQMAGASPL